ncbi:MAG: hypothetical protein K5891_06400 [Lachnospiraceae bacterium]|nr:hypothetical protein [Lachnospiraceae bacterium]
MNLIFCAYTHAPSVVGSHQLTGMGDDAKKRIYEKNICVALVSAKHHNPADEVALITTDAPEEPLRGELERAGVRVIQVPFDSFQMPDRFRWKLAFYKLCALHYAAGRPEYDRILLLDTDTFTVGDFTDLWEEADHGILLYPLGHTFSHFDRLPIRETARVLEGRDAAPVQYGGEFVAGNRKALQVFTDKCMEIYGQILSAGDAIPAEIGDEAVLSVAAERCRNLVRDACPYIYRYWTRDFYLVSTNAFSNPVPIWHLPAEKDLGMLCLYEYYRRKEALPSREKAAGMLGFPRARRPLLFTDLYLRFLRKKSHAGTR